MALTVPQKTLLMGPEIEKVGLTLRSTAMDRVAKNLEAKGLGTFVDNCPDRSRVRSSYKNFFRLSPLGEEVRRQLLFSEADKLVGAEDHG